MERTAIEEAWRTAARMLSHEEARAEQRLYWSRKSAAERLAAMTELNRRMNRMRGIDVDKLSADLTPRFVRRSNNPASAEVITHRLPRRLRA